MLTSGWYVSFYLLPIVQLQFYLLALNSHFNYYHKYYDTSRPRIQKITENGKIFHEKLGKNIAFSCLKPKFLQTVQKEQLAMNFFFFVCV